MVDPLDFDNEKDLLTDPSSLCCEEQTLLVTSHIHDSPVNIQSDGPQISISSIWQFNHCESRDSLDFQQW